jgi:hypothetical protein
MDSDPGGPKNIRIIRIRIHSTVKKRMGCEREGRIQRRREKIKERDTKEKDGCGERERI